MTKEKIQSILTRELESRPEIIFAYLFGSFVDGERFRDVDVAVYLRENYVTEDSLTYSIRLSLLLERLIGYQVDVITLNTSPDHLVHHVTKGEVIVNRDDALRTSFVTRAWSRYFDIQVKRRAYLQEVAAGEESDGPS